MTASDGLGGFDPRATYSAAAEDYARASQQYWQFLSTRTLERLELRPGEHVLDAACGTAPATIAAARLVSPGGRVVGVDYAEGMLAVARRNVAASGAAGVELVQGDMLALPYDAEFDAVICVLGIFFVDDMAAAARALWSHVRPGGRIAIATFGTDVWEPVLTRFVDTVARVRPDIERVLPWRRAEDPAVLLDLLHRAGADEARVEEETTEVRFDADDWPLIVMGSGLRRIANDLGPARDDVLAETMQWARQRGLTTVRVTSNYARARKPSAATDRLEGRRA